MNRNVNLEDGRRWENMEENAIKIEGGIMINIDVSVKIILYVKKSTFGIPLHVVAKIENNQQL